jgi:hypothetical protein
LIDSLTNSLRVAIVSSPSINYEGLFGTHIQLFYVLGTIVIIVLLLNLLLDEDTSPQVVVMVGLTLICIAGGVLWASDQSKIWVEALKEKGHVSEAFASDFSRRTNWFAYILPFFSAAIGTNLISDVITKRLHYKRRLTLFDVFRGLWEILKMLVGLCLLPFVILFLALPSMFSQKVRENIPSIRNHLVKLNRRMYLKVLKVDIVARSRLSKNARNAKVLDRDIES